MPEFSDVLNGVASVLTIVGFVLHCAGDLSPGGGINGTTGAS